MSNKKALDHKKCAQCNEIKNSNSILSNDDGTFICEECAAFYCEY